MDFSLQLDCRLEEWTFDVLEQRQGRGLAVLLLRTTTIKSLITTSKKSTCAGDIENVPDVSPSEVANTYRGCLWGSLFPSTH